MVWLPPKAEWKRSAPDSEVTEREDATFIHPWPDIERAEREDSRMEAIASIGSFTDVVDEKNSFSVSQKLFL